MAQELTQLRTYNTKFFDNSIAEIHAGHIHYKNGSGDFEDVDFTLEDMGTSWRMTKANYNLYVSKTFNDAQLIRYDNKFDGADHTIYFTADSLQWIHKTNPGNRELIKAAQNVTGVIDGHTIVYANAFGNDVDFVIELLRHGFRKYIRFNTQPTLNPPTANHVPVLLFKYQGDGLSVKATEETAWDGVSFYEGIDGFEISEGNYKSYLAKAYIWDSSPRSNRQKVKIFFEKRNDVLWNAKVLPKAYFTTATYPVMADASTTIAPSANGEGFVNTFDKGTWAGARDAASGDAVNNSGANMDSASSWEAGPLFGVARVFIPFDTSSIPDSATITGGDLDVYAWFITDADNDASAYVTTVESTQASATALATTDFSLVNAVKWSDDHDISTIVTNDYTTFTLNATGYGAIDKSGYTKFALREGHDFDDHEIATATGFSRVQWRTSETAGSAQDPKLTVTYTVPGSAGIMTTNTGFWGATY